MLEHVWSSSGPVEIRFLTAVSLQNSDPLCPNLSKQRARQHTRLPSTPYGAREHQIFMGMNVGQGPGAPPCLSRMCPQAFHL